MKVSYTLRKSKRARQMRLAVYCDGSVVVTAPQNLHESVIERFIQDKANWLFSKLDFFSRHKTPLFVRVHRGNYLKYKNAARALLENKIAVLNNFYNFPYGKISVRNQKTRWGSCSHGGNLSFNYKLIFLEEKFQNYVIAHELCHLKEFNHSKKFWDLVARTVPDWFEIRSQLKRTAIHFTRPLAKI